MKPSLKVPLPMAGGWSWGVFKVPSKPKHSMIILYPKSPASTTAQAGAALCSAWIIAFQQSLHTLKSLNTPHSFAVLSTPECLRLQQSPHLYHAHYYL